jgi:DNA repair exonuclease SbcCD ATPase subunit
MINSPPLKISNDKKGIQFLDKITLQITNPSFQEHLLEIKTKNSTLTCSEHATILCKDIITTKGISLSSMDIDDKFVKLRNELKREIQQELENDFLTDTLLAMHSNQLESHKRDIDEKFTQITQELYELSSIQNQKDSSFTNQIDIVNTKVTDLRDELSSIQNQSFTNQIDSVNTKVTDLRDELSSIQNQSFTNQIDTKVTNLREELSSIQNQSFTNQIDSVNTKVTDLREELRREFYQDFQESLDEIKKIKDDLSDNVFDINNKMDRLTSTLEDKFTRLEENISSDIYQLKDNQDVMICEAAIELLEQSQHLVVDNIEKIEHKLIELQVDSIDFLKEKLVQHECDLGDLSNIKSKVDSMKLSLDKLNYSNVVKEMEELNVIKDIQEKIKDLNENVEKFDALAKKMIIFDEDF